MTCENAGDGVHGDAVGVAELGDAGLGKRLRLIGQGRNRLDGFLAEAVAERTRRTSPYDTTNILKAELRQSGQQAQCTMSDADQHRRADALERLITRTISDEGSEWSQGTTLLLMADCDLVDDKLGRSRLAEGTPLLPNEFHPLACDADILCGLFKEGSSEPIWMGSTSRHPNFAL